MGLGESRARGPWGPLAPGVKVRGERIFHRVGSVGEALHGRLLAHSVGLGGESGPGLLGAPGPRYGVHVVNAYPMKGYTW